MHCVFILQQDKNPNILSGAIPAFFSTNGFSCDPAIGVGDAGVLSRKNNPLLANYAKNFPVTRTRQNPGTVARSKEHPHPSAPNRQNRHSAGPGTGV